MVYSVHGKMGGCFMLVIGNSVKCGLILLVFRPLLSNTLSSVLVLLVFNLRGRYDLLP